MLEITKDYYVSVICTWLSPRLPSMRAIATSSVHHVCCGLQFMVNDYTGSHGTCLRQDVYNALCAHGLRPSEACYSSDTLVVSVDYSSTVR